LLINGSVPEGKESGLPKHPRKKSQASLAVGIQASAPGHPYFVGIV